MTRRAWPAAVLAAALLLAAGAGRAAEGLAVGQRPPRFAAKDLQGRTHDLAAHEGQVVVLHFWASWCPYCRGEIPKLIQLHEASSGALVILSVSVDEDPSRLDAFLARTKLPYPVIPDGAGQYALAERYRIVGLPTTYIIDAGGRIAAKLEGVGDLQGAVQRVLDRTPGA
jgi:thiol-disulfide isomerase/thioredoxin